MIYLWWKRNVLSLKNNPLINLRPKFPNLTWVASNQGKEIPSMETWRGKLSSYPRKTWSFLGNYEIYNIEYLELQIPWKTTPNKKGFLLGKSRYRKFIKDFLCKENMVSIFVDAVRASGGLVVMWNPIVVKFDDISKTWYW